MSGDVSDRDIAAFEAGIKLGALYHQFIGTPLSLETVEVVENAISRSVSLQPYVKAVKVRIDREKVRVRTTRFGYCELCGDMLDVQLVVEYRGVKVHASLKFDGEYPLMFLESVESH
ncbi:MAG TPA: hypothetical protein ENF26_05410 [Methanomicrobia archaeon]|nr:7 8-dihydroneopterin aldolase MptD [Candidatus Alkanophaga volatiphilum]HDO63972.1 hypothetical protein [Methanomicrobia archaeon]HEX59565.1 hypothetical protein [Methanomicrobia archaeon]